MSIRHIGSLLTRRLRLGLGKTDDFNGAQQEGAGWYQLNQRDRMRCSASYAFIEPNRRRSNLHIQIKSRATRLIFEGTKAIGVEIDRKGKREIFRANKEIVLSAGAYQSPQLLQLSGVGAADELNQFGISLVKRSTRRWQESEGAPGILVCCTNLKTPVSGGVRIEDLGRYLRRPWSTCLNERASWPP